MCRGCGRCCYAVIPYLQIELMEEDISKVSEVNRYYDLQSKHWWMKRKDDSSCVYLNAQTKECSIYEIRPIECRACIAEDDDLCLWLKNR